MNMRLSGQDTKLAIMQILLRITEKYNSTYCWPKRSTICNHLKKFYGITRCLSTIDYHLGTLKKMEFINSYTRYKRLDNGQLANLPSNRQIIANGYIYLKKYGIKFKKYLHNWVFKGIKPARAETEYKPHPTPSTFTRPARGPAGPPESVGNILKTIKLEPF